MTGETSGSTCNGAATRCARCGAPMHCGALAGDARCWCMTVPALPAEALRAGLGCLCRACLESDIGQIHKAP
jgi:Cysteine-rich CWC